MKKFNPQENESPEEFWNRVQRGVTDTIIDQIEQISDLLDERQIISILDQLDTIALEVVEEECRELEKYEVCRIARNLINERKGK